MNNHCQYRCLRIKEASDISGVSSKSDSLQLTRTPPWLACLRRYRRRWKIERLFAWLQNFRRLVVRYERYAENFRDALSRLLPNSTEAYMRWLVRANNCLSLEQFELFVQCSMPYSYMRHGPRHVTDNQVPCVICQLTPTALAP